MIRKRDSSFEKIDRYFYVIGIFAIAMAALEAIVVVYLRQIYYPNGFDFPITFLSPQMLNVEWLRELATLVMLVSIGLIGGKNPLERFAWFLYSFAIWDIFYYIWLKILLDWPSSLLTWDILFLIPVPWIGPVLAPVICSLTMILLSVIIIYFQKRTLNFKIERLEWLLTFSGVLIILATYMWDYFKIIIQDDLLTRFWTLTDDPQLLKNLLNFQPVHYNWMAFMVGETLMLMAILLIIRRAKSNTQLS